MRGRLCSAGGTPKVFTTKADHPGLAEAVSHLRGRDVLVIWKLDRPGRPVKGLVDFAADLHEPCRDVDENLGVSIPTLYRWVPATSR